MSPRHEGQPWDLGGVSTAEWSGVPLAAVLERAGLDERATEVAFSGADEGIEEGVRQAYAWGLPLAEALRPEVLLATEMNGRPLEPQHGAPLRLVVPGWYGMASVKWLAVDRGARPRLRRPAARVVPNRADGGRRGLRRSPGSARARSWSRPGSPTTTRTSRAWWIRPRSTWRVAPGRGSGRSTRRGERRRRSVLGRSRTSEPRPRHTLGAMACRVELSGPGDARAPRSGHGRLGATQPTSRSGTSGGTSTTRCSGCASRV